jgi:hypothetical protein
VKPPSNALILLPTLQPTPIEIAKVHTVSVMFLLIIMQLVGVVFLPPPFSLKMVAREKALLCSYVFTFQLSFPDQGENRYRITHRDSLLSACVWEEADCV